MCWLPHTAACSLFTLNPSPAYLPFLWSPLTAGATDLNENLMLKQQISSDCQAFTMSALSPSPRFLVIHQIAFLKTWEGKWKWLENFLEYHLRSKYWQGKSVTTVRYSLWVPLSDKCYSVSDSSNWFSQYFPHLERQISKVRQVFNKSTPLWFMLIFLWFTKYQSRLGWERVFWSESVWNPPNEYFHYLLCPKFSACWWVRNTQISKLEGVSRSAQIASVIPSECLMSASYPMLMSQKYLVRFYQWNVSTKWVGEPDYEIRSKLGARCLQEPANALSYSLWQLPHVHSLWWWVISRISCKKHQHQC